MSRTLNQIIAVVSMNLQSIPQRIWTSLSTIVAVAVVTLVLLGFLAMAHGFEATVKGTGSADVAVVLRKGGDELNSVLTREQAQLMQEAPGVAKSGAGKALVSPELYVVIDGIKRSSQTKANLPLRGLGVLADQVREGVRITKGRMFRTGTNELVVGRAVSKQFDGFEIGRKIRLASQNWIVVGEFEAGGSVFESELWADVAVLQNLYQRGSSLQTLRVRMDSPASLQKLKNYSEADPRLKLDVKSEPQFYAAQSEGMSTMIKFMGWPLAIAMSFGALAGALNTMYASVDARMREIATMRAIGFGGFPAFVGTMVESLLLSAVGGIVGATLCFLFFNGLSASTLGGNFTQVVFAFKFSGELILQGVILALVIGFVGGVFPAWRAARVPLLAAFRAG